MFAAALGSSETVAGFERIVHSIFNGRNVANNTAEEAGALIASLKKQCGGNLPFSHGIGTDYFSLDRSEVQSINFLQQSKDDVFSFNPWPGTRGRCVKYRQQEQSCIPKASGILDAASSSPKQEGGKNYERALLCSEPKSLVCTGADFHVRPSTCVKARQKDICYHGPWWNSTICPRTEPGAPRGGLSRAQLMKWSLPAWIIMRPGEVSIGGTCKFWARNSSNSKVRAQAQANYRSMQAQFKIFSIFYAGLGRNLGGDFEQPLPTLDAFLRNLTPLFENITYSECKEKAQAGDPAVLAELSKMNGIMSGAP